MYVVKFSNFLGLCKLTAPTHPLFPWSLIQDGERRTRLGEFSPIGRLLTLGMFFNYKSIQNLGYFFNGKNIFINFGKKWIGLGTFWTIEKHSSGQPEWL
jgi:hypothetical protein